MSRAKSRDTTEKRTNEVGEGPRFLAHQCIAEVANLDRPTAVVIQVLPEPVAPDGCPTLRQLRAFMHDATREEAGRRIAKAFAHVIAPERRRRRKFDMLSELCFFDSRGLAEFPPCTSCDFCQQQPGVFVSRFVAEAYPNEMEQFMNEDEAKCCRIGKQAGFEDYLSATDVRGGVDRSAMICPRQKFAAVSS